VLQPRPLVLVTLEAVIGSFRIRAQRAPESIAKIIEIVKTSQPELRLETQVLKRAHKMIGIRKQNLQTKKTHFSKVLQMS
jgi:hypothetical protein